MYVRLCHGFLSVFVFSGDLSFFLIFLLHALVAVPLQDHRAMVTDFGVARIAEVSFEHEMTQGPGTEVGTFSSFFFITNFLSLYSSVFFFLQP